MLPVSPTPPPPAPWNITSTLPELDDCVIEVPLKDIVLVNGDLLLSTTSVLKVKIYASSVWEGNIKVNSLVSALYFTLLWFKTTSSPFSMFPLGFKICLYSFTDVVSSSRPSWRISVKTASLIKIWLALIVTFQSI